MPIDSSANLLFSIGADSSDAEANVQRFRALLGKDLSDISAEFDNWSRNVFGNLSTVGGAMTGLVAGLAAAAVALGGALYEAGQKAAEFDEQILEGTHRTGLSTEQMVGLSYAAKSVGVSYETLIGGLTKFESTIVKANAGNAQAIDAFARLGISQETVQAGEKNLLPLFLEVADKVHV